MSTEIQNEPQAIPMTWRGADRLARRVYGYEDLEAFCKDIPKNGSFLDLGAGESDFAYRVACARPDITVVALDSGYVEGPPVLDLEPLPNYTQLAADATELPFDDQKFDVVASHWLLPHLSLLEDNSQTLEAACTEALRVLAPGGGRLLAGPANERKHRGPFGEVTSYNEESLASSLAERLALRGFSRWLQKSQNTAAYEFFGTGRWIKGDSLSAKRILDTQTGEFPRLLSSKGAGIAFRFAATTARHLAKNI